MVIDKTAFRSQTDDSLSLHLGKEKPDLISLALTGTVKVRIVSVLLVLLYSNPSTEEVFFTVSNNSNIM